MDKFDDPRTKKLPKWAQSILQSYKIRVRELEKAVEQQPKSRTAFRQYSGSGHIYKYLPQYATVQFGLLGDLEDGRSSVMYPNIIEARLEPDYNHLKIMGEGCLLVHPQASNVVTIKQEKL
jgi:hypothetical protein